MATFNAQITGLVGAHSDATEVKVWLDNGVVDVINRLRLINPAYLTRFASAGTIGTGGTDISSWMEILHVRRGTYDAREIPPILKAKVSDSTSLYYATTKHPVYYKENNTIYVLPQPAANQAIASRVIPGTASSATASSISSVPNELYYLVVLYASLQVLLARMSDLGFPDNVDLPVAPIISDFISVAESLPTFTAVAVVVLPSVPADADIDFSGIGSTPAFTAPNSVVLPALSLGADLTIAALSLSVSSPSIPIIGITDGTVESFGIAPSFVAPSLALTAAASLATLVLPVPPVLGTLASVSESQPTFVSIPPLVIPASPDDTDVDFTDEPADPAFSAPAAPSMPTLTMPTVPTISDLTLSASAPTAPSAPSFTAGAITMTASLPAYTKPTSTYLVLLTAMNTITTLIETSHDVELAANKVNQVNAATQGYMADIQNELNEFNMEAEKYRTELNKEIAEAQAVLNQEAQEYAASIQRYQAQVEAYIAEVNAEVQTYLANEVQQQIQLWSTQTTTVIAEYREKAAAVLGEHATLLNAAVQDFQADLQVWQGEINKALQTYQQETGYDINKYAAEVNAAIQNHQQDLAEENAEFQTNMAKYTADLQYVNENNTTVLSTYNQDIAKYQAEVNAILQKWNLEQVQGAQSKWIAQRNTEIAKYAQDVQLALLEFNKNNAEYQASIQEKIQEAANLLTSETEEARLAIQSYSQQLQQYQIDVNAEVQEYLQKDVAAELAEWTTKRENLVQEFNIKSTSELQRHATELNQAVADYNASLQNWQQLIQQAISTYQQETGYDLSRYSAQVQAVVAEHGEDLKAEMEEFNAGIAKYSQDLQRVTEYNQRMLNKYSQQIGAYGTEIQGAVSNFMAILQKLQQQHAQYLLRYAEVKKLYEQGFIPFEMKQQ